MTKSEILRAIREKCLDCCCGQANVVKDCGCENCPLYLLRNGRDPTPRVLSPAQLEHLQKMRAHRDEKTEKQQDTEGDT